MIWRGKRLEAGDGEGLRFTATKSKRIQIINIKIQTRIQIHVTLNVKPKEEIQLLLLTVATAYKRRGSIDDGTKIALSGRWLLRPTHPALSLPRLTRSPPTIGPLPTRLTLFRHPCFPSSGFQRPRRAPVRLLAVLQGGRLRTEPHRGQPPGAVRPRLVGGRGFPSSHSPVITVTRRDTVQEFIDFISRYPFHIIFTFSILLCPFHISHFINPFQYISRYQFPFTFAISRYGRKGGGGESLLPAGASELKRA